MAAARDWQEKVVLVTGGSAGLGLAIGRRFAAHGARVVLAARDSGRLAEASAQLESLPGHVTTVSADVTKAADVKAMLQWTIERHGRLDVLVNNAGRSHRGTLLDTAPETFAELLELNFLALVRCTQAAAPHLIASGGHVVNIGSLASKAAAKHLGAYPASKFPVAAFSQQLRYELGERGVHVLLVCPGPLARDDAGQRYADQATGLPAAAKKPGGGVKLKGIAPEWLAERIVGACRRRQLELIVPWRARLLFALAALSPRLGDWILRRMMKGD